MSAPRRQSGRLALQTFSPAKAENSRASPIQVKRKNGSGATASGKRQPVTKEDAAQESDEQESDFESDASEYGKRPVKRQKLKKSTRSTGRKSKSKDTVCYLTTIPLDVLLEIFGQLEPKALISLARTNHAFRDQLLSKASGRVWRNARENVDGPDCPEDFSEQRWAHLLYGEAKCESCGAKNIQRVDYGLRRRACTRCLKANLVVTSSFSKHFPHLEDTILDLIPHTNIGGFAHGHASNSSFYWKPDIEKMAQIMATHDRDIHMRVTGARKKLEDFTAERIALVATVASHTALCKDWSRQVAIRRQEEEKEKCDRRYNAIKIKFMDLGYTETDISRIKTRSSVYQTSQLTDRVWNKLLLELEPFIQESRERRLKAERDARIADRTRIAKSIYKAYKKTLLPSQWRFLPGLYEVLQLPAFNAVVNAPDDVNVEAAHFKEALDVLPGFIVSWPAARKAELLQLIDKAVDPLDTRDGLTSSLASGAQTLDLATTVFMCAQRSCGGAGFQRNFGPTVLYRSNSPSLLIGWEWTAGHQCHQNAWHQHIERNSSIETMLNFSKTGATAAASLVTLAGLNEEMATSMEMDNLDLRFLCLTCPIRVVSKNKTYSAFSWRAAVSHFVDRHHAIPQWRLLNSAEAQQVKADEGVDPTLSWSCNHCSHFLDDYHTFSSVSDHVKTAHAIVNPTAPADLFRYLDLPRAPATFLVPAPPAAAAPPGLQYHCKRCSTLGKAASQRIFKLDGVKCHLKAKHKVSDPVANEDWEQVK